ncbi:hypothetical protein JCM11491_007151 [Sporobolomyces phaffii]
MVVLNGLPTALPRNVPSTTSKTTGGTRWSYTGMVPNAKVFYALFRLPVPRLKKEHWKQKKLPIQDFEQAIGTIGASIRYGYLSITGSTVTLAWNAEDNTYTLKGTYGKS